MPLPLLPPNSVCSLARLKGDSPDHISCTGIPRLKDMAEHLSFNLNHPIQQGRPKSWDGLVPNQLCRGGDCLRLVSAVAEVLEDLLWEVWFQQDCRRLPAHQPKNITTRQFLHFTKCGFPSPISFHTYP